jgi:D-alanine--D-alanine ligase
MNQKIGVIHGGTEGERDVSVLYGKKVSKILTELGLQVTEFHLHPNGSWTIDGKVDNLEENLKKVDKVWNCLIGSEGEQGTVETVCDKHKVRVVGHTTLHSQLANDKKNLHKVLDQHKIDTPFGKVIFRKDFDRESVTDVFKLVSMPAIVKPLKGSGAWGVYVVNNFSELLGAVEFLISKNMDVIVEKLIVGTVFSVFVYEHKNLLHTHVKVHDSLGPVTRDELMQVRNEALYIHNVLGFEHHVEYDFILSKKNGKTKLFFLEANTHPSLVTGYIKKVFDEGILSLKDYVQSKMVN